METNHFNFWQPVITSVGALLASGVGGYLAHFFLIRRENTASKRKVYENLFSPILFKIFGYYEYSSLFRRDLIADEIFEHWLEDIFFHTRNNLNFATPGIVSICESIESLKFVEDLKGSLKDERLLRLVEELLNSALRLKLIDDKESKEVLEKYRALYFIWRIFTERYGTSGMEVMERLRMSLVMNHIEVKPKKYKRAYKFYSKNIYDNRKWEDTIPLTLQKIGIKKEDRDTILNEFKD